MTGKLTVSVVDAGLGNLRSVVRALEAAARDANRSVDVRLVQDVDALHASDAVVMPGQGAFGDFATALEREGGALGQGLRACLAQGKPYLGLCLGLQLLFEQSEEAPGRKGLGVLRGRVVKLQPRDETETLEAIKVPHMGWNQARVVSDQASVIGPRGAVPWFYFVHSYVVEPEDERVRATMTMHGREFVSSVAYENVVAVQFHPEKSQRTGLSLLQRWMESLRCV